MKKLGLVKNLVTAKRSTKPNLEVREFCEVNFFRGEFSMKFCSITFTVLAYYVLHSYHCVGGLPQKMQPVLED